MKINWFPGHMNKTLKELSDKVKLADVVLYVLDARCPISSLNPEFQKLINNKPIVFVINKVDYVNLNEVKKFENKIVNENSKIVYLDSTKPNSYKEIILKVNELCIKKLEKNKLKGINIPLRMVVIGVPNVGKSTLINNFAKKNKTEVGNKPGVTKSTQWVKVDGNIELLDTPGTLWPKFEEESVALHLAYIGSIKDEVLILTDLVFEFIKELAPLYPENFKERYGVDVINKEPIEIYEEICLKRGYMMKNKEYDYERGAKAILDDFRKGKLGKIVLE
ncbi:MAG: ribosome biogenesis GTPase YlqF [Clostridiales bacterium]|nr:ribosome biogenesis GTPase YlqF [Clostridiales bacterium]